MALTIRNTKLSEVTQYPGNSRRGDISAIAASLETNGQYKPIVVQKSTGHILAGNHTAEAATALGWEKIQAVYVDVDDDQARKIVLADNRTSDLAQYDDSALAALLAEVPDLTGTGFDDADYEALTRMLQALDTALDIEAEWEGMPEYVSNNEMSAFKTTVHFASEEDANTFFEILKRPKLAAWWFPEDDGIKRSVTAKDAARYVAG